MHTAKRIAIVCVALGILLFVLAACGSGGGDTAVDDEVPVLIYATFSGKVDRIAVERFNSRHSGELRLEVKDYSDAANEGGKSGIELLMTEINAGRVPDILDLAIDAYRSPVIRLAQGGYLENLWPYIENDPELGRSAVMEAPLKAAEIDGGLYMAFSSVEIDTLVGREAVVGNRYSWSLAELLDTFSKMPENSTILEYCVTKDDMLYYTSFMSLESFVDMEEGKCYFDSEKFRTLLEFVNTFPLEFDWSETERVNEEIVDQVLAGKQMLTMYRFRRADDIQLLDAVWGGRAAFPGYPVEDGSVGSYFHANSVALAMSSASQHKAAAWEFIREMFLPKIKEPPPKVDEQADSDDMVQFPSHAGIPINRCDFDIWLNSANSYSHPMFGPIVLTPHETTDEEAERILDFYNSVDKFAICDPAVYSIVQDQCGPYFAGDKSLDETVELIQRRVSLYVNEQR